MLQRGEHMNLQEIIIKRYFEYYPKHSLRQISKNTNIQITRVFRILNGSQMKLNEYESFDEAISKTKFHTTKTDQFINLSRECLCHLSDEKISELMIEMNQALKMKSFLNNFQHNTNTNQFA